MWPKRIGKCERISLHILLPYLFACNIAVLVLPFIPPWESVLGKKLEIRGYVFPAVAGGLLVATAVYYRLCFGSPRHSIIRLAELEVKIKSMCPNQEPEFGGRHRRFGYKYRVFITSTNDTAVGKKTELLRWCFGWTLDSPIQRVDPHHDPQLWLEQHGPGVEGCICDPPDEGGHPMGLVSPTNPTPANQPPAHQALLPERLAHAYSHGLRD